MERLLLAEMEQMQREDFGLKTEKDYIPDRHFWDPKNQHPDCTVGAAYQVYKTKFNEKMEKFGVKSNQDQFWKYVLDETEKCVKAGIREDVSRISL